MNNKSVKKEILKYCAVMATIFIIMVAIVYAMSFIRIDVNRSIHKYKSIEDLKHNTILYMELPDIVNNASDLNIETVSNTMCQFYNDELALKLIENKYGSEIDVLGIESDSNIDESYIVTKDDIHVAPILDIRYRVKNEEYPHVTILNWDDAYTTYGLMIDKQLSLEDALNILGLDMDSIE